MLIRSATPEDLNQLMQLSALLPPGMTSMPFDKSTWEKRLALVEESIQESPDANSERVYLLVMEDLASGKIVGTAGIVAGVGLTKPFYNYKITKDVKVSEELDIRRNSNLLNLVNDFTGETELISLFLLPEFRSKYSGQILSRCRYLFMSDFPDRFSDIVFAEIRGWLDQSEKSPFWEHLGRKFFDLPFAKADFISAVNGSQFISDLMPTFPVYMELLPQEAIDVIGKPHDEAAPAMRLLEKEGFKFEGTVDIFDAGPVMQCHRENIESMKQSQLMTLDTLTPEISLDDESKTLCIVSNASLQNYRMTLTRLSSTEEGSVALPEKVAELLNVGTGDQVRILEVRAGQNGN